MRMASGLIIAWDTTLLLDTVPHRLHSRVYSLHTATYGIVGRASLALTALVMAWAGPRAVAVGSGIGSILVGATWWWVQGRRWPPAEGSAAGEAIPESFSHNPQKATTQPDSRLRHRSRVKQGLASFVRLEKLAASSTFAPNRSSFAHHILGKSKVGPTTPDP